MKNSRSIFYTAAIFALGCLGSTSALALSPPWVILQNEMKATVGADKCVEVDQLKPVGDDYNLDIEVCNHRRAEALARLITPTRDFGGVLVHIRVFGPDEQDPIVPEPFPSNPEEAREVIQRALHGDCYFVKVDPGNAVYQLFIEFKPRVIQFYADNIADAYDNLNLVAADAFANALGLGEIQQIHVGTTTSPIHHKPCDGDSPAN